jgi:drug/metabolite transporter, DME family
VPAFEASALLLLEPALNPVWAWMVHGERPGAWALAGGGLILAASLVNTWRQSRAQPAPA